MQIIAHCHQNDSPTYIEIRIIHVSCLPELYFVQTAQKCAVFFVHIAHNKIMKKTLFFLLSLTILATGLAMPAKAAHCDVQRGDSMWRIAQRYNVLFKEVLKMNRHFENQHMIHPKDEVQLPGGGEYGTEWVQLFIKP